MGFLDAVRVCDECYQKRKGKSERETTEILAETQGKQNETVKRDKRRQNLMSMLFEGTDSSLMDRENDESEEDSRIKMEREKAARKERSWKFVCESNQTLKNTKFI